MATRGVIHAAAGCLQIRWGETRLRGYEVEGSKLDGRHAARELPTASPAWLDLPGGSIAKGGGSFAPVERCAEIAVSPGLSLGAVEEFFVAGSDVRGIMRVTKGARGAAEISLDSRFLPAVLASPMRPAKGSGLPPSIEAEVPAALRYWTMKGAAADTAHRALRASGLLAPDRVAIVDGQFRRIEYVPVLAGEPSWIGKAETMKVRHYQGIPVMIDRPEGFVQQGRDRDGKAWTREYKTDYGYIPGTQGGDGDGLDVFLGPDPSAPTAFWIEQTGDGGFDEWKLMLGFPDADAATACYLDHCPAWALGSVTPTPVDHIKALLGQHPTGAINKAGLPSPRKVGREYRKTAPTWAVQMDSPFQVRTLEGVVEGKAGDFLCEGPAGDMWPHDAETFLANYEPVAAAAKDDMGTGDLAQGGALQPAQGAKIRRLPPVENTSASKGGGWIGVDLDGTLANSNGGGAGAIGEPIPAMLDRVAGWLRDGKDVRIFTARVGGRTPDEVAKARAAIEAWCKEHLGRVLPITNAKDPSMIELWDDRAKQVVPNTGARVDGQKGTDLGALGGRAGGANQVRPRSEDKPEGARGQELVDPMAPIEPFKITKMLPFKKDGDERYALGIVLEPEPFGGKGDLQGDTYSAEEIRGASDDFMENYRNMGLSHTSLVNGKVHLLENYIAPCDMEIGGQKVSQGTWLMAVRYVDDALWADVKAGRYTGFSIGGDAIRRKLARE